MFFGLHLFASQDVLNDTLLVDDEGGADGAHRLPSIHVFLTPCTHRFHQRLIYIGNQREGQRMLLNYIPAGAATGGVQEIRARGYTEAVTDSLRFTSRPDSVVMDSVRLKSIWRTGNYLNLSTEVKFTEGKRQLYLVMDKATWHSDTVRAYLAHNMLGEQAYFWRKCYLSFYIGAVWKLQSCKVLRVYLNDVIYPKVEYYDFAK